MTHEEEVRKAIDEMVAMGMLEDTQIAEDMKNCAREECPTRGEKYPTRDWIRGRYDGQRAGYFAQGRTEKPDNSV